MNDAGSATGTAPTPRPVRLLLVNPRFPESFWSFRWAIDRVLPGPRALNPPLGLATLAALCPAHWQVRIVDENVEPVPLEPNADVVGVCAMAVQAPRQRELLARYRARGCHVVAGGSHASLSPERCRDLADTVVVGEAERTWPAFCRDFERGRARAEYVETGTVDLAESPVPRFDLLALDRYTTASVQFSRGCPYRCEFCDIVVMFGRRPRTKSPEQIGRELDRLRGLGVRNVFFVDDNLIGHRPRAKALLRYLVEYRRRHGHRFTFGTEVSINVAEDEEMLALLTAAGFGWVFVGIESPDEASLRETGKTQNLRADLLESVQRLYRHGLDVLAGFIVGFDHDTVDTFERQRRFITEAGIQVAMVGLLTALPRTPLRARLAREGRLLPDAAHDDNTRAAVNFLPRRMSRAEMSAGYRRLWASLTSDASIARRIRAKTRYLRAPAAGTGHRPAAAAVIVARLLVRGILPGGPRRWLRFAGTLLGAPARAWPVVVTDWIAGLALRAYAFRHLLADVDGAHRRARQTLRALHRRFAVALRGGALDVALAPETAHLVVTLRGAIAPAFFTDASRRLERLLRAGPARVTVCVEHLATEQAVLLERMLARLRAHGDRVSVHLARRLQPHLRIDLSVFHVEIDSALPGPPPILTRG